MTAYRIPYTTLEWLIVCHGLTIATWSDPLASWSPSQSWGLFGKKKKKREQPLPFKVGDCATLIASQVKAVLNLVHVYGASENKMLIAKFFFIPIGFKLLFVIYRNGIWYFEKMIMKHSRKHLTLALSPVIYVHVQVALYSSIFWVNSLGCFLVCPDYFCDTWIYFF